MENRITIINKPEISAIYFVLLQCGYEFYSIEKDPSLVAKIEVFRKIQSDLDISFFSKIRQNTCEVYPYWPRAATLETATFYLCKNSRSFRNFNSYKQSIINVSNIADKERNEDFWEWVKDFPFALKRVLESSEFIAYLDWESSWISQQNNLWESSLQHIQKVLDICVKNCFSPVQSVSIILNPIKCTYSSDYFKNGDELYFILGAFRIESVLHEFLHHVVHHFIPKYKQYILNHSISYPDIDSSYYLDGDENGKLNAFEEYIVRKLTCEVLNMNFPSDLDGYIKEVLSSLGHPFSFEY